uniref:Uncharacterized protein n=1 Tax=Onchocerca volvulus TaxID=6282 RepID=A0A8R1TY12_ONCVO
MDALAGTVYANVIILGATRWIINVSVAGFEFSIQKVDRSLLHLVAIGLIAVIIAIILSKHSPSAPFLLVLLTSSAGFLLYSFLVPEARGKKLPDHMPGKEPHNLIQNIRSESIRTTEK